MSDIKHEAANAQAELFAKNPQGHIHMGVHLMKPFHEITTDAEYLRAVGMGPDTHPDLWGIQGGAGLRSVAYALERCWAFSINKAEYIGCPIHLRGNEAEDKWIYLANALRVLGPEMDRRGWRVSFGPNWCDIWEACTGRQIVVRIESEGREPTHTTLLATFYNAHHAQGNKQ